MSDCWLFILFAFRQSRSLSWCCSWRELLLGNNAPCNNRGLLRRRNGGLNWGLELPLLSPRIKLVRPLGTCNWALAIGHMQLGTCNWSLVWTQHTHRTDHEPYKFALVVLMHGRVDPTVFTMCFNILTLCLHNHCMYYNKISSRLVHSADRAHATDSDCHR